MFYQAVDSILKQTLAPDGAVIVCDGQVHVSNTLMQVQLLLPA